VLFNSPLFVFVFLPITFGVFAGLKAWRPAAPLSARRRWLLTWVTLASLVFYEYWDPKYLLLLGGSIGANYWLGRRILACDEAGPARSRWMRGGIALNLAVLAWFKYAGFLAANVNALAGTSLPVPQIVLPLAISFITFQKIAFLVDCRRGIVRSVDLESFVFFVSFFPPLIAGPIFHYREFEPQVKTPAFLRLDTDMIVRGFLLFLFGLAKKVLLADRLAVSVQDAFSAGVSQGAFSLVESWRLALSYALQIYLDFSGYSNMAIGLALMFGIVLPLNFNAPYQATSLVDFWQRWHMTLSRFLRDYVYIPLGGNRRGRLMRYRNLLLTMLLGGLWHGAGWNFVVWGALHGAGLAVNHAWREWRGKAAGEATGLTAGRVAGWAVTFLFVVFAWIPFRIESPYITLLVWKAMVGLDRWDLSISNSLFDQGLPYIVQQLNLPWYWAHQAAGQVLLEAAWLAALVAAVLRMPPAEQWTSRVRPGLAAGVLAGAFLLYFVHLNALGAPSEFIYFHF
jgi:D-alanyl-lipoteichoic acid acyltransferase DltB (MBOAT superfamily)